jgi:hypothetical protein
MKRWNNTQDKSRALGIALGIISEMSAGMDRETALRRLERHFPDVKIRPILYNLEMENCRPKDRF